MTWLAAATMSFCAAYLTGWLVRFAWSDRALDAPGPRRSHIKPTTRLGGVAVAAGFAVGLPLSIPPAWVLVGMAAAVGIAGAMGLAEDLRGMSIPGRLGGQLLAGFVAAPLLVTGHWGFALLGALWIVAFTNMFNFMDGVNGLAGLQVAIAGLAWMIVGSVGGGGAVRLLGAVSFACGAGFLPHNLPKPRVFMGDFGAYVAGAWLAGAALVGIEVGSSPIAMLAPLALFVFDTSWTLACRVLRRENVFLPHQQHLYQRLVLAGWTHVRTTVFVASVIAATATAGLLALVDHPLATPAAVALAVCGLVVYGATVRRVTGAVADGSRRVGLPEAPGRPRSAS